MNKVPSKPKTAPSVELWSDGGLAGANPAPAGWAAILKSDSRMRALSGFAGHRTNNYVEVLAVISGLEVLRTRFEVKVFTDSQYVINGIYAIVDYLSRRRPDYLKTNRGLWDRMRVLMLKHNVRAVHVKGHAGVPLNEMADQLAGEAATTKIGSDFYLDEIPEYYLRKQAGVGKRKQKRSKVLV